MVAEPIDDAGTPRSWVARARGVVWRLITSTVSACMRYRVTGLAAEAAFFAILSLPPLIFGLAGSVGYVVERVDEGNLMRFRAEVLDAAGRLLTEDSVNSIVEPTLDTVLNGLRVDVLSLGFIIGLWSGSRALNVFVDTITIMYGLGGRRGIVKTRMLSFGLYVVGLLVGAVVLPLVLAGPRLVERLLPENLDFLNQLYWPTVIVLSVAFLTSLYHLSVPVRTSWRYDLPGAIFAFSAWVLLSWLMREILTGTSTSIFGPLAAPIAVLLWLYVTALAVLIGAALNAAFDRIWPEKSTAKARLEVVRMLRLKRAEENRPRDIDDVD